MSSADKTVFISYRRDVSSFIARAVFQDLRHGYDVFMDVESIDSGTFDTIILNQIEAREHFIVLLTPGTEKRLAEPDDWFRREIEHAIKLERNIVPILANNFTFKDAKPYLKNKLKELPRYSGITLYHEYFDDAMVKLRDRFLKKPVNVSVTATRPGDLEAVQSKIDIASTLPTPTKTQLSAEYYFNLGYKNFDEGKHNQAIKDYDKAIQIDPQYAKAYYGRGLAYKFLGNSKKAIDDFRKFLTIGNDAHLLKMAKKFIKELGGN